MWRHFLNGLYYLLLFLRNDLARYSLYFHVLSFSSSSSLEHNFRRTPLTSLDTYRIIHFISLPGAFLEHCASTCLLPASPERAGGPGGGLLPRLQGLLGPPGALRRHPRQEGGRLRHGGQRSPQGRGRRKRRRGGGEAGQNWQKGIHSLFSLLLPIRYIIYTVDMKG